MSGTNDGPSKYSMSVSMYRGGGGRGSGRPRTAPPDLPSLLLDARIVYLGMPVCSSLFLGLKTAFSFFFSLHFFRCFVLPDFILACVADCTRCH